MLKRLLYKLSSFRSLLNIKVREKTFENDLKYLFFDNHSDTLLIIFSAFTGNTRRYNYVRGLSNCNYDKLYILDPWGYQGSYNMYENGRTYPEEITNKLITKIVNRRGYKKILTAGSSKGGTCAIYFGLNFHADEIYAGACQYNLGSYLHRPDHEEIFKGMMGKDASDKECEILNKKMPNCLESHIGCSSRVHVFYSKLELTYERQIVDLIAKLKECNIPFCEIEASFETHEDVGKPFLAYLKNNL